MKIEPKVGDPIYRSEFNVYGDKYEPLMRDSKIMAVSLVNGQVMTSQGFKILIEDMEHLSHDWANPNGSWQHTQGKGSAKKVDEERIRQAQKEIKGPDWSK